MPLSAPPIRTPFAGKYGGGQPGNELIGAGGDHEGTQTPSWPWLRWMQDNTTQTNHPAAISSVPTSATATADGGEMAHDANFLYVAVSKNLWKKVALVNF